VIIRAYSIYGISVLVNSKFITGSTWVLIFSSIFSSVCIFAIFFMNVYGYVGTGTAKVIVSVLIVAPLASLFMIYSFAQQGLGTPVWSSIFQSLGHLTVFLVMLCLINLLVDDIGLDAILWVFISSIIIVFICFLFSAFKTGILKIGSIKKWDSELAGSSINFWVASVMALAVNWSGVLVAGALLPSEDLALLNVSQRSAQLITFVLMVVNVVIAPQMARAWHDGDILRLKKMALLSSRYMALTITPVLILLLTYTDEFLSIFGDYYKEADVYFAIICIGQVINVVTGCVGYLLSMTGHDKEYRKATIYTGIISIALSLILVNWLGLLGASISISISVVLHNMVSMVLVRRHLGFWPVG
jgi:O-antigen/teichoic acid export membrane protein